ncbi:ATP12 family chaperone protein [Desertibaculum subflavum]|uniref:ATP12 family chaperone protein n=1 Tax=Desertibaculum subflavum TaxID=2268458 RepID=UPI0013C511AF
MKRFYKQVTVAPAEGGRYGVLLDGRPVRTPARTPLTLPTLALAEAVAAEWAAQEGEVKPLAMPLTRLATTAIDRVPQHRAAFIDEIVAYIGSDLLCYRADGPADLVSRQSSTWDPPLAWAAAAHGIALEIRTGVLHRAQPEASTAAARAVVEGLAAPALTSAHVLTTATGSAVLALALVGGALEVEAAVEAALLDEIYQAERWGQDREAMQRRREIHDDIGAAARFARLARA